MNRVAIAAAWIAALTIAVQPGHARQQDLLHEATTLYAAARYEEALATIARAADLPGIDRVTLYQYRAFCLIALGEIEAAAGAFDDLVDADPRYDIPASAAGPRIRAMFAEARVRQLPRTAGRLLASGREAYEAGTLDVARDSFALLREVLGDEALEGWTARHDVELLADGFMALLAGTASGDPDVAPDAPSIASAPRAVGAWTRPELVEKADSASRHDAGVEPPVAVLQSMPPWVPPSSVTGMRGYQGVLRIEIGVDGRVKSARIEEPTHPSYDVRLLHAARQWVFRPATRDGHPVESEQVIAVQLHPRN